MFFGGYHPFLTPQYPKIPQVDFVGVLNCPLTRVKVLPAVLRYASFPPCSIGGYTSEQWGVEMKDMQAHLEKLRADATECLSIRDLATEPAKRELFARLAMH